jgi:hypothetical protein
MKVAKGAVQILPLQRGFNIPEIYSRISRVGEKKAVDIGTAYRGRCVRT